jgi:hypothetical protein
VNRAACSLETEPVGKCCKLLLDNDAISVSTKQTKSSRTHILTKIMMKNERVPIAQPMSANLSTTFEVRLPAEAYAGMTMQVPVPTGRGCPFEGRLTQFVVPPGLSSGQVIRVPVPEAPVALPMASQPQAAQQQGSSHVHYAQPPAAPVMQTLPVCIQQRPQTIVTQPPPVVINKSTCGGYGYGGGYGVGGMAMGAGAGALAGFVLAESIDRPMMGFGGGFEQTTVINDGFDDQTTIINDGFGDTMIIEQDGFGDTTIIEQGGLGMW